MIATAIRYKGRVFGVAKTAEGIVVRAHRQMQCFDDEEKARRFLGDNSLPRGKARQLLAAELRNEGPLADPAHPRRIK